MASTVLSDSFGTLSQIAWLFAQLPQIWQNHRDQSVDGLALPFLLSWLLGDVTNLLGCLLTHQLPFQRNLAIYFTIVDLVLIYQYRRFSTNTPSDYQALGHHDNTSGLLEDETPEERLQRHLRQVSAAQLDSPGGLAREYTRSMSRLGRKRQTSARTAGSGGGMNSSLCPSMHDEAPAPAGQAVKSPTHEQRGRSLARSSPARLTPLRTTSLTTSANRCISDASAVTTSPPRSPPITASRYSTLPFLGLFTFLVFNASRIYPGEIPGQFSRAWDSSVSATASGSDSSTKVLIRKSISSFDQQPIDWQRLIGRTSAWLCAILYLTSRLPQIWKNYRRKSVEGLSILLFIMAFLGNLTYVISVLTSPQVITEPEYLAESFPYLLGSGGTLCFDFTIFVQSRIYPSDRRLHRHRKRTMSASRDQELDIEQQAALISPVSQPSHLSFSTPSRSRTRTESTEMEQPHLTHENRTSFPRLATQSETPEVDPLESVVVDTPVDA